MTHVVAVQARWHTELLGEFYCLACGGDRNYRRQRGRNWLRVAGIPLLPLRRAAATLQCTSCRARYGLDALAHPTSGHLLSMLRNAHHAVALAVLAASGGVSAAPAVRDAALAGLRDAGFTDLDADGLLAALAETAGAADAPRAEDQDEDHEGDEGIDPLGELCGCGSALVVELHTAIEPLAPHLLGPGLTRLLTQGAVIALADGPYRPAERATLRAVGQCLGLGSDEIDATLAAAARTPRS
ncbi:TerB family tellurite resistance protein [Streptacidiphilus fuscans]|uniref:TerB family tellurite resistance protein n=1 Tax=Streptacidiphilus fuscans TaxID=2789292 RepID=UPI002E2D3F83|nr:TerB family tellurite resistance protein [Streptacidiphilus fuscans]